MMIYKFKTADKIFEFTRENNEIVFYSGTSSSDELKEVISLSPDETREMISALKQLIDKDVNKDIKNK